MIWLQVLLWVAFLILPFTGKLNPGTGKISYKRMRDMWLDAKLWAKDEERNRLVAQKRQQDKRSAKAAKKEAKAGSRDSSYQNLEEVDVEASNSGGGGKLPPCTEEDIDRMQEELYEQTTFQRKVRAKLAEAHFYYDVVTYPMRSELKQNRLFSLLTWDSYAFAFCMLLFFVMSVAGTWANEELRYEQNGETLTRDPLLHTFLVAADMMNVFTGEFWTNWHTQITFQLIKVLFSLSAVPFFIFTIGPLAKLFAHTDPTAYTRDGRITVPDPNGLSSYLRWIKEDVLDSKTHAEELDNRFAAKDMLILRRAVKKAEGVLAHAWHKPGTARKVTTKEKLELDKKLHKIVNKEKATAELYQHCFPDHVLVDEFLEAKAQELEKKKQEEEEKKDRKRRLARSSSKSSRFSTGKKK